MSDLTASLRYKARRGYLAVRRNLSSAIFDRRLRIDTSREANLEDFGLGAPDRVRYEPSGWLDLRRILRPEDITAEDVFLELGCGKGRVVLQAARYPFARVIGVEIAPELTAIAHANVEALRDRIACGDVELVTADALEYRLPADVTVAYLYNPFRGQTFERFLARLIEALDRDPRPFRLIYSTPMEHDSLVRSGRFRVIREARGLRPGRNWSRKLAIRMYAFQSRQPAHGAVRAQSPRRESSD